MTPEQAAELRKPFSAESIGKLPRVTCKACRDAPAKNCGNHQKVKCSTCGNWITSAHLHLDYVGHAEITDRLLAVDPAWAWEPVAFGQDGLPQMGHGGLWIRLTVGGVTRLGFGSADGKTGPDAVKEMIGDALRNAAMRFGVGLDLWGAKFKGEEEAEHQEADERDAAGQEQNYEQFAGEIAKARNLGQLRGIAERVRASEAKGGVTRTASARLASLASARLAELEQGAPAGAS